MPTESFPLPAPSAAPRPSFAEFMVTHLDELSFSYAPVYEGPRWVDFPNGYTMRGKLLVQPIALRPGGNVMPSMADRIPKFLFCLATCLPGLESWSWGTRD